MYFGKKCIKKLIFKFSKSVCMKARLPLRSVLEVTGPGGIFRRGRGRGAIRTHGGGTRTVNQDMT